jgi:peptidoglycan hydrolase-like protein with peptidoglycan-binding domain
MRKISIWIVAMVSLVIQGLAFADSAREIFETAQQRQIERWEGVNAYAVDRTMMGHTVTTWFVRTEYEDDQGEQQTFFVPMTEAQIQNRQCDTGLSPEELDFFASSSEMVGDAVAEDNRRRTGNEAGMPGGEFAASGTDPWNTMNPRVMMGGNAEFLRAAADAKRADQAFDPTNEARESLNHMQAFMDKAEVLGTETVNGRKAWHIRAEGLNHVEKNDGSEYRIEAISMYVDTAEYVPLSMKMDGTMTADGKSQPMTMETVQADYRKVPGSNMYESYRQVMSMSGMLTPEQQAQMAEAQAQLAEFEKQKKSMPAQQVAMMESMMGPQLKMIENMAKGNGIEFETVVDSIRINPEMKDAKGNTCPGTGSPAVGAVKSVSPAGGEVEAVKTATSEPAAKTDDMTLMIQEDLAELGYGVSPTGKMDTDTAIAISQYQAENGMPVTGEPSPQLAGILAAGGSSATGSAERSPEELQAAQQACLQQKMEEAQAAQKKKRGFGSLMRGVGRLAGQLGDYDLAQTTGDIYQAGATVEDFSQAAKDLGLTEDDIAACQNPG